MTDFAKFLNLYQSVGIEPVIEKTSDGSSIITITANETDKTVGYVGFFTEIQFDPNGKFIQQCIYE